MLYLHQEKESSKLGSGLMFRGNVVRPSHEGGLLISFTGSSPALGSTIETEKGTRLGKVDTVLGSIHNPWVHVYPISKGLDVVDVLGENTIIKNKRNLQKSRSRRDNRSSKISRNSQRNERKNHGDNDWICSKCDNDNFGWRERCNKCSAPKSGGNNSGGRPRRDNNRFGRPRRDNNRFGRPRRDNERSGRPRRDNERSGRPRRDNERSGRPRRDNERSRRPRRDSQDKGQTRKSRDRTPKRIRGKSRTHFGNRELDNIFKKRDE